MLSNVIRAAAVVLVVPTVLAAQTARADIDCAQCRAVCKAGANPKAYPEELGPESPTTAPKHKTTDAEAAFTDARKKDPAFGGRDLNGAISGYKRAVLMDADNSIYRNHLAGALMSAGFIEEAVYNLEQATKLVPSEAKYLVNLGYAHHRRGDETRALLNYMRALMLDPHDVRARLFAGYALEILGYTDEAVLELKKVLNQDDRNEGAKRALARLGLATSLPPSATSSPTANTPNPRPIGDPPPPLNPR